ETTAPASDVPPVPLPLPSDALLEKSDLGPLPVVGPDGTKPWRFYAKPFSNKSNLPMIAIIVTGLGEGKNVTESATKLPENVTLSFSPYARDIASWTATARVTGHEAMVNLPLQPTNYPLVDPGPYGLMLNKNPDE